MQCIKKTSSLSAVGIATTGLLACKSAEKIENSKPTNAKYMGDFAAPKLDIIKIALIGVGARGSGHAKDFASLDGTEIVAICDLYKDWHTTFNYDK